MEDGEIQSTHRAFDGLVGEVVVGRAGGILVLDGPQEAVSRLIANDPALRGARHVKASSPAAIGALAALVPLMGLAVGGQKVFQLDDAGQAMFDSGALSAAGDGFFRLFSQGADGTFSGHGALKPLAMGPERLATAQLAMVTIALTAAIKEVQEAVERVEDKVDLLRDILDAERDGEILGVNRALRRRAQHLGFDSTMSDADWHAIDDIGVEVEQQIERLRSFVRKRLVAAEDAGRKISGRLEAVEHARDVAETLTLLVVAQDSLFLFQQMRVLRIKATQPEFALSAVDEARALLDKHTTEDADLVQRIRTLVEERDQVEALEVLHFRAANRIARLVPEVDENLVWFAAQRGLPYESFDVPPLPGVAEVVDEVKERGAAFALGSRRAVGELTDKVRSRKQRHDAVDAAVLESGDVVAALPTETADVAQVDPEASAGRFARARSSAITRMRRAGGSDATKGSDVESDPTSSTVSED